MIPKNTSYFTDDDGEVTAISLKSVTLTLDNTKEPEILIANSIFEVVPKATSTSINLINSPLPT